MGAKVSRFMGWSHKMTEAERSMRDDRAGESMIIDAIDRIRLDLMRKKVNATDDEVTEIQLKIEKLYTLQTQMLYELRNKKQTNDTLQKAEIEARTQAQDIADSLAPPAAPMRF